MAATPGGPGGARPDKAPGADPTVWRAGLEEAEPVARLLVEFRDWLGRDWPSENAFLAGVERLMESGDAEFLLVSADPDSPPAGVCQLRYRYGLWLAAEDCWLEDLYVRDPDRRAGLGAALVGGALARARARGCRRIELDVNTENVAARALYERFGFETGKGGGQDLLLRRRLTEAG